METNQREPYMTAKDVCEWLKININYLYRLVGENEFPVKSLGHRTRRYVKQDIVKWLEKRQK